jgi:tetratricopeptide (TPR) repeat protein
VDGGEKMVHQQWLKWAESAIKEIEKNYSQSPASKRPVWRRRFMEIKRSCDEMLEAWAKVEEQLAELTKKYPGLSSSVEEFEEEFWLNESAVRQFRQGQGYYGLTMFQEAGNIFKKVIDDEPDFLLGRIYYGLTLFHEGKFTEASRQFQLVSNTARHEAFAGFARHMLGCIAVKEGDDHAAIRQFKKAVELMSDHSDAWFNMGVCHYRLKEYHEAIPCFYQALSTNPDDWESMYYLSHCYREIKEWGSVSFWRLATYEKTKHPHVLESIAHDYEEMGLPHKALEWYRRLAAKHPKHPGAYHGMAWNLFLTGKSDEAFSWIKKGLTLFPKHSGLLLAYVWMCMDVHDHHRAEKALNALPDEVAEEPVWTAVRSRLSIHTGNVNEAADLAEKLLQQENSSIRAMGHYHKGRALMEKRDLQEAIQHFRQAQKLVSSWKDPLFFEGICHLIEGHPDATRDCWSQLSLKK